MKVENRTIFENDNLHVLRSLDTDSIDLIYLDPPFNSNRTFEASVGSEAAGAAFKDFWAWMIWMTHPTVSWRRKNPNSIMLSVLPSSAMGSP